MNTTVTNEHLRKEFDNFEKTGDVGNLLEELRFSTLIAPVDVEQDGCVMIEMAGDCYIPLFTDIHEYQKVKFEEGVIPSTFEFNFYLELLKNGLHGFIVNVESERVPITGEFLDFMDTDYILDQDYQPFTAKEIRKIYDSIDNSELEEFLEDDKNRWDFDSLMEILLKSDLLTPVGADRNCDGLAEDGVISTMEIGNLRHALGNDKCAILFSSRDRINPPNRNISIYAQLVNLPLFIDFVLKRDLEGIRLDENITLPREFLINFMKGFRCPCMSKYDDYVFLI